LLEIAMRTIALEIAQWFAGNFDGMTDSEVHGAKPPDQKMSGARKVYFRMSASGRERSLRPLRPRSAPNPSKIDLDDCLRPEAA